MLAHFYWGGGKLSPLRLESVKSFKRLNPRYRLVLWRPTQSNVTQGWDSWEQKVPYTGRDCLPELEALVHEVRTIACPFPDANNVQQSDWARLKVLYDFGGVYCDTDIQWLHSLPDFSDTGFAVSYLGFYQTGFLAGARGHWILKLLLDDCRIRFDVTEYQCLGSELFTRHDILLRGGYAKVLDPSFCNPFTWKEVDILWSQESFDLLNSYGVHWLGGHPTSGRMQNEREEF